MEKINKKNSLYIVIGLFTFMLISRNCLRRKGNCFDSIDDRERNMLSLKEITLNFIDRDTKNVFEAFRKKNKRLPYVLAEQIFHHLDKKKKGIPKECLQYFFPSKSQFINIKFDADGIDDTIDLAFLAGHPFETFKIFNYRKLNIELLFTILNHRCENLRELSIANSNFSFFYDSDRRLNSIDGIRHIIDFKNLKKLNLSYTDLNTKGFEHLCNNLLYLEKLNISGTEVLRLSPIVKLKNLVSFKYYDKLGSFDYKEIKYLRSLNKLEGIYLTDKCNIFFPEKNRFFKYIFQHFHWENLKYFSIFVSREMTQQAVKSFLNRHPKLLFFKIHEYFAGEKIDFSDLSPVIFPRFVKVTKINK